MIPIFYCPQCKIELVLIENNLLCKECHGNYSYVNKIGLFPTSIKHKETDSKIKKLNDEINEKGYGLAIKNFNNENQELKSSLTNTKYDQSVDVIFHCIGNNNQRVLEIKSGLGNKTESLSNIFKQVYSIEFNNDLLEFQKIRFNQKKCENILISKCDLFKLPFPDDFFDLILCNDLLDTITEFYDGEILQNQNRLIKELKRVLGSDGKIIFGIGNKFGIKPSKEKNHNIKQKNVAKQSYSNFKMLFEKNKLYVKSYWVFPSYDKPYFSGKLEDKLSLKWFFNNLDSIIGKQTLSIKEKLMLSIIKKLNYLFIQKLLEIFSPSFIFCCGKNPINETLEDWIKRDTNYENYLMLSRRMKILFVLLNKNKIPEKIVSVKRYGNEFPVKLQHLERKFPNMGDPQEKAWIEKWFSGRSLNPLNLDEVTIAINWLIHFQNNSKQELMDEHDVNKEIELIKSGLHQVSHGDLDQYYEWLDQYKNYVNKNKIFKTAVHGDFWITNILFDPKIQKTHVLDWELFKEKGNPLLDFLLFLYDIMAMTGNEPLETFKKNLTEKGEVNKIVDKIKLMMEEHFGFKLDIVLLLRFYLMRKMIPKQESKVRRGTKDNNPTKNESILYVKMLDALSE